MKYYLLDYACATRETGSQFPQIQKMSDNYNYQSEDSVYSLSRFTNSFPDFNPNLDAFILHKNAKISDLLSSSPLMGSGFLISEKFKNALEKNIMPPHKYYPAKIIHKDNSYNYYWIHILCDLTDYVDYNKSEFVIAKNYTNTKNYIQIKSKKDFLIKKEELKQKDLFLSIKANKIFFIENYFLAFDLFSVSLIDYDFYISQNLKNIINQEKITGVNLIESNKFCVGLQYG
mgnify:CR=1 FL=1